MSRIMADLKAFAKQYMRNPFGAAFSIGFPLLLLVTFGAMFSPSESPEVHLLIQDLDETSLSAEFIEDMNQSALNQAGSFTNYMAEPTYAINETVVREYELSGALVIPAGFEENALNGTPVSIVLFVDYSSTTDEIIIETADAAIRTFEENSPVFSNVVGIEVVEIDNGEFVFIDFFLPGIIALTIMLNCLMILASLMADYWSHGYFKILKTTPLRKWEWILSKLIWYLIVMGISIFLMLLVGIGVFEADASFTPMAVALILAGVLLFSSIGILIGAWAKNTDTAAGISQAIGQPMMFLSGIFWQLDELPEFVQIIAKALPLTYLGEGLRATMLDGDNTVALENLAVVLVLALAFFVVASRLVSWKEK